LGKANDFSTRRKREAFCKVLSYRSSPPQGALFSFVSLLNLILPPYGGAFLALLTSLYVGYDPMAGLISVLVGTLYSLIAGAVAGALFGWLYNSFVERF
jgi:hypothetical protein